MRAWPLGPLEGPGSLDTPLSEVGVLETREGYDHIGFKLPTDKLIVIAQSQLTVYRL